MQKIKSFVFIVLILFLSYESFALNLDEAIIESIKNSSALKAAEYNTQSRNFSSKQALGNFLPVIEGSYRTANRQYEFSDGNKQSDQSIEYSVQLRQNIFSGGSTLADYKIARSVEDEAKNNYDAVRSQVAVKTVETYINAFYYKQLIDLYKRRKDILEQKTGLLQKLYDNSQIIYSDLTLNQVIYSDVQSEYLNVSNNYIENIVILESMINQKIKDISLPQIINDNIPKDYAEINSIIEENNPTILLYEAKIRTQNQTVTKSRSNFYPQVNAVLSHTDGDNRVTDNGVRVINDKQDLAMIQVSVPLFSGGKDYYGVKIQKAEYYKIKEEADQIIKDIKVQAKTAYDALKLGNILYKNYSNSVILAESASENYQKEYEVNNRTLIDVLNMEEKLIDSKISKLGVQKDIVINYYRLISYMGII